MRFLVVLALLCVASDSSEGRSNHRSHYDRLFMIKTNRVPKEQPQFAKEFEPVSDLGSSKKRMDTAAVCDECKREVERVREILRNPIKRAELELLLSMWCETLPNAYKATCKEIAHNLDKLQPYVANPEKFCTTLHFCEGGRKTTMMRPFLMFTKKFTSQTVARDRDDALCQECQFALNEVKTLLQDPSIQQDIEKELKNLCGLLGSMKDECVSLVDQYFPTIVQEIEQLLADPKQVCSELGLCSSSRRIIPGVPLTPAVKRTQVKDDALCQECQLALNEVKTLLGDPSIQQEIEKGLEGICGLLGSLKDECVSLVEQYFSTIVDELMQLLANPKQVCTELGLCSSAKIYTSKILQNSALPKKTGPTDDTLCEECQFALNEVKTLLGDPSIQQEIEKELESICGLLGSLKDECVSLIEQYFPTIVQKIEQLLADPKQVCSELGLCPSGRRTSSKILQSSTIYEAFSKRSQLYYLKKSQVRDDALCEECQFALNEVKTLLGDPSIQQEIEKELESICGLLGSLKDECVSLIEQYFPTIVQEIEQLLADPKQVCSELGLCSSERKTASRIFRSSTHRAIYDAFSKRSQLYYLRKSQKDDALCQECQLVLNEVKAMLAVPSIQQEIEKELESICGLLGSLKDECVSLIEQYFPTIVQEIEQLLADPKQVCSEFGLCPSGRRAAPSRVLHRSRHSAVHEAFSKRSQLYYLKKSQVVKDDALCEECQFALNEVKTLLGDPSIQQEIEKELESICGLLGSLKDECVSLIEQYFPTIVQEIEQLLADPKQVCTELGLCSSRRIFFDKLFHNVPRQGYSQYRKKDNFLHIVRRGHNTNNGVLCEGCELVLREVKTFLENPSIQQEIEDELEKLCGMLGGLKDECDSLVEQYVPELLDEIVQLLANPQQVCAEIHLCPSARTSFRPSLPRTPVRGVRGGECELCRQAVGYLRYELQQPFFQKRVAGEVKRTVCHVAGSLAQECDDIVDQYLPDLFFVLVNRLVPYNLCHEIKLCGNQNKQFNLPK